MKPFRPVLCLAWLLLCAVSVPLRAQEGRDPGAGLARADSLVAAWVRDERIPGAVLLVVRDGGTVLEKAYGFAQLYEYGV
ncbi:MAG TPA: hypothetical protein VLA43_08100, partial [Longimicrobiales bacterium]|nr:hypothetical protein [Longimicrobiales bacterium]